jgi:predicted Zn-dependent protease
MFLHSIFTNPTKITLIKSIRLSNIALLSFLVFIAASAAQAQSGGKYEITGTGGSNMIQGRVYLPSTPSAEVRVKVRLESTDMAMLSTVTDVNGSFRFGGLAAGNYTILVDAGAEYELYREPITIDRESNKLAGGGRVLTVPVYLLPKRGSGSKAGVVDASLANVPKSAVELYNKARESAQAGDSKKAIEQLKAAIALHADFALAFNELGVQHLKLGQATEAAEALRTALKLSPDAFMPRLNYGIALLETKQMPEAEQELREAVKKNDSSPVAHLYLGMSLVKQRKLDEGEKELTRAASSNREDISMAHYYLAGIYWGKRDYKRAADELETYLKLTPKAPDAEKIRGTIKDLRSKK